jgi:ATP-dependent helicase HrpA
LQTNGAEKRMAALFEGLIKELERLVPKTFVSVYDKQHLAHLVRYVNATAIRARRASVDFEKDRAKSIEISKFADDLTQMLTELSPSVSDEKRQAIEEYFWMIEEFKVSVFAQELKTAIPISTKRLEQKAKQIRRMV